MATIHNRGAFSRAIDKDIKKVFFQERAAYPAEYTRVFANESVDGNYEKYSRLYGIGAVPEKTEGGQTDIRSMAQAGEIEFNFPTYGYQVAITEEMMEDDRTGIFGNLGQIMARSCNYTREITAFNILTAGFSANAGQLGTDGVTLFADNHPIGDTGSTQDNQVSDALSTTSLQAALTAFKKQKGDDGIPNLVRPALLIIPPDLEWKAKELMLSEFDPDSANNAVNTLQGEGLSYMVFHFGSSTTNWFLTERPGQSGLVYMNRVPDQMTDYVEPGTGNKVYRVRFRFQAGHLDWRGTYGSTGA